MRVLFAGSPGIAVPSLEAVAALGGTEGFDLAGLLTNPDSPRGRSARPEPTECAAALRRLSASTPVLAPEKLDAAARGEVAALSPDLLISFAYGKIFGPKFLALFPLGGINVHPSLLPKYRGPTPIPAAIINRERETGITIQKLALEMDSGDILSQEAVPLDGRETTASLGDTMARKAAELLPAVLAGIAAGTIEPRPQDHSAATYCSLIAKEDGVIAWNRSAAEIETRIRAFTPWPLSWTMHGETELFVLKAEALGDPGDAGLPPGQVLGKDRNKGILIQTGDGILAASELQYRARKALGWKAFLNGTRDFIGTRLG
ncbi:MAG: methionyl-tRNA formyltransferase [Treponema sp.]|jgi:methionyl-tRNA formyltransferase|nr:methionyl-tRNA formyltransferase [Treponema sp.]